MKWMKADLLASVGGTYDQTRTTIAGRVFSKTIGGQNVLGAPVTKFIDVFTDTTLTPAGTIRVTDANRLFICAAPVNGTTYDTLPIMLYDFNLANGAYSYVGRIDVQLPNLGASVHTIRGIRVTNDSTNTGWKIFIATSASVPINGGLFVVNSIDKADFIPISFPTIPMATGNNQKAVYKLEDPANIGVGNLNTTAVGIVAHTSANRIYVHNGSAATHQYYVFNSSTTPTWASAAVTVNAGTPGTISDAGHAYANNDPVIVTSLVNGTGLTNNSVYFVRNPVAGVSYELSATSGGASITVTLAGTAVIGRAWGTTGALFVHKTGNLPSLTGTLLSNDSQEFAQPVASPINGAQLDGQPCAFICTSTNLYLGRLDQLTAGTTSWASLSTANLLGTTNQITAPSAVSATWSNTLNQAIYITNSSKFISKKLENNVIRSITGELNNQYYEGFNFDTVALRLVTVVALTRRDGWIFAAGGTAGQRGIIASDFRSDTVEGYSYIITKVLNNPNAQLAFYTSWEKLWDSTGNIQLQYRTSGFGSASGGWIDIPQYADLAALSVTSNQIQFKILFNMQSEGSSSPAQINELLIGVTTNNGISENWEFSDDFSDNQSPSRVAFRLKQTYASVVPQLFFRAYDLSDALLVNHNTTAQAAQFEYSTNNGVSWLPLGTIPNTVGTLVRYTFTSPPGVDIRPGLRES